MRDSDGHLCRYGTHLRIVRAIRPRRAKAPRHERAAAERPRRLPLTAQYVTSLLEAA
jgi:hypothetical protein